MTRTEAESSYGILRTPSEAARIIGVRQPYINQLWKNGRLTRIETEEKDGTKKRYCIDTEIRKIARERQKADTTD